MKIFLSDNTLLLLLAVLAIAPVFSDPYHQELRGFTFLEWLGREIDEALHGEKG